jgi:Middle or third domain of peptidase_M16
VSPYRNLDVDLKLFCASLIVSCIHTVLTVCIPSLMPLPVLLYPAHQHLPPPNLFIPSDLTLDPALQRHADSTEGIKDAANGFNSDIATSPVKLVSEDGFHLWHLLDSKFPVPKVPDFSTALSCD